MTRDEVQAVINLIGEKADRAELAASNDHQDLATLHRLDGRCDGLRDAARLLTDALEKSEAEERCPDCGGKARDCEGTCDT